MGGLVMLADGADYGWDIEVRLVCDERGGFGSGSGRPEHWMTTVIDAVNQDR